MIFFMINPKTILYFIEYLISDQLNFRAEIKAPLVAKSTIVTIFIFSHEAGLIMCPMIRTYRRCAYVLTSSTRCY